MQDAVNLRELIQEAESLYRREADHLEYVRQVERLRAALVSVLITVEHAAGAILESLAELPDRETNVNIGIAEGTAEALFKLATGGRKWRE